MFLIRSGLPNPPNFVFILTKSNTFLTIGVRFDTTDNSCQNLIGKVVCTLDGNDLLISSEVYTYITVAQFIANLTKLEPSSQYHCTASVLNEIGWSRDSDSFILETSPNGSIILISN